MPSRAAAGARDDSLQPVFASDGASLTTRRVEEAIHFNSDDRPPRARGLRGLPAGALQNLAGAWDRLPRRLQEVKTKALKRMARPRRTNACVHLPGRSPATRGLRVEGMCPERGGEQSLFLLLGNRFNPSVRDAGDEIATLRRLDFTSGTGQAQAQASGSAGLHDGGRAAAGGRGGFSCCLPSSEPR